MSKFTELYKNYPKKINSSVINRNFGDITDLKFIEIKQEVTLINNLTTKCKFNLNSENGKHLDYLQDLVLTLELNGDVELTENVLNNLVLKHNFENSCDKIDKCHNQIHQNLSQFLYSRQPTITRSRYSLNEDDKTTITIPLIYDITTSPNMFLFAHWQQACVNVTFNKLKKIINNGLSNLKINATISYKTGKVVNPKSQLIESKNFNLNNINYVFHQVKYIRHSLLTDYNTLSLLTGYIDTHYIILKFNNDLHDQLKNISLRAIKDEEQLINHSFDLDNLRYQNWSKLGLNSPKEAYYIIPFCNHQVNDYKLDDCTAINMAPIRKIDLNISLNNTNRSDNFVDIFFIGSNIMRNCDGLSGKVYSA